MLLPCSVFPAPHLLSSFSFPSPLPSIFSNFLSSNNGKLSCTGSSPPFSHFLPCKGKKKVRRPPSCCPLPAVAVLHAEFPAFSETRQLGRGAAGAWAFPPPPQTSRSGTPQGQVLLSLGTPQDEGQGAVNWPQSECESVCVCECETGGGRGCCDCWDPIQFPQITCFYPFSRRLKLSFVFCLWETTGTSSLGTRLFPSSLLVPLFQPLQTVQSFSRRSLLRGFEF